MKKLSPAYKEALRPVLLALADDELIIGHRHSEWTGWAPHIEEDIAFSSIAQDEIGHAALLYRILAETSDENPDHLALGRQPHEYINAVICERQNRDWAYTLARHFLYEEAERTRLESLQISSFQPLADAAGKILREERYHQLHADAWFRRLSGGPMEGRHQFALALSEALPEALGLFEVVGSEARALENGVLAKPSNELQEIWLLDVMSRIDDAGLPIALAPEAREAEVFPTSMGEMIESQEASPPPTISKSDGRLVAEGTFPGAGGRYGRHTDDFLQLWDDLTKTFREEPSATW